MTPAPAPASQEEVGTWRPRRLYAAGSEPDPRFSLANERTALAWIRTALALVATGVALDAFEVPHSEPLRTATIGLLALAACWTAAHAFTGWWRTEHALRIRRPLPAPRLAVPVALTVAAVGVLTVGLVL